MLINWGNSNGLDAFAGNTIVNTPTALAVAGNKLSTFQALEGKDGITIPDFTSDKEVAAGWIGSGNSVVCRTVLRGHSGAGIVLASNVDDLVDAPLYVKYIKKQDEYRVHVAFGEVIDVQAKRKRRDVPEEFQRNHQVRNHQTGWVYCRENITEPTGLRAMAMETVGALGLDFGAVDIIHNAKRDQIYVLEVNTAPGLEGTTVTKYADAFEKRFK